MPTSTDPLSDHRLADAQRLEAWNPGPSAWQRLCPSAVVDDPVLRRLEDLLDEPEVRDDLWELEATETYPEPVLAKMRERGLMGLFAPAADDPDGTRVTAWHLSALNAQNARRDQSLAVTISVNALGLLPAWVAATPAQLDRIHEAVRGGAFSSLLLSELAHGSNLLCNQAQAERGVVGEDGTFAPVAGDAPCTHYRIRGEKDLINGANHHGLLFTFLRTRNLDRRGAEIEPLQARADFSMFWLPRGEGMEPLPRWRTSPARGADISGIRFCDAVVPKDHLLGREHGGMNLAQKTLTLSRGGVASLAAGCLNRARDLATHYASERAIYGTPIRDLGAIADHLVRLEALDRIVSAVAVRTTAMLNTVGLGAAHYTAVAKAVACEYAEMGVREGQRVLGARSLLREAPYERLVREVLLYGVFDGTSHVMLQELSHRLCLEARRAGDANAERVDTLDKIRDVYAAAPEPIHRSLATRSPRLLLPLDQHLENLAALDGDADLTPASALCRGLFEWVREAEATGAWAEDQGLRLDAARVMTDLEAIAATAELADPVRRRALGLPAMRAATADGGTDEGAFAASAVRLLCGRVRDQLRDLGARSESEGPDLVSVDKALARGSRALAARCRAALQAASAQVRAHSS